MRSKGETRRGAAGRESAAPSPPAETGRDASPSDQTAAPAPPPPALHCPHFPPCRGCPRIPVPYAEQLDAKRQALIEALGDLLPAGFGVADTIPSPRLEGYRNQARLVFRRMSRGGRARVGLGLYLPGTHRVVHIPQCPIQPGRLNAIAHSVIRLAEELRLTVYDERHGTGSLRYLAMRCDRSRQHVLVTLIVGEDAGRPLRQLAEALREQHPGIVGVGLRVNRTHGNVLFAGEDAWTLGADRLEDRLGRLRVLVPAQSFMQVNHAQAEWIYARLEERLGTPGGGQGAEFDAASEPDRNDTPTHEGANGETINATVPGETSASFTGDVREVVLDLYSGIGGIALHLARAGRLVVGVEEAPEAVEDARRAAHMNSVPGARFVAARVEEFLGDAQRRATDLAGLPLGALVLNPPRSGCRDGVMQAVAALAPERIAYASCNPATLARDLRILGPGYVIDELTPIDMIPLTQHVESLCFLRRV